ncbi:alpha/beta hydrolase [Chromobacterium haemolyticum]|nr:alpha/beta hydrolase [Chromobacterium haemolyticum]
MSAGFDPLRDEAFLYADKLRAAEVEVEHLHLEGMVHAFLNLEAIVPEVCREVYQRIGAFLNR